MYPKIYKYSFIILAFILYISFNRVLCIPYKYLTGTNDIEGEDTLHSEDYIYTSSQLVLNATVRHSHYVKLRIFALNV